MPREKFQTLTEQMFYILLCMRKECCGVDVMTQVADLTDGRVKIGPGTMYNLLEQFVDAGMIRELHSQGRKRSYILTEAGRARLESEYRRQCILVDDYRRVMGEEESKC